MSNTHSPTWLVVEFTDVFGETRRFRVSETQLPGRWRLIARSYLGYPGMAHRILPGLGYQDCEETGDRWAKSGEQALEEQLRNPMTQKQYETWMGITGYYERCRVNQLDSGD